MDNREAIARFYIALNGRRVDDLAKLVDPDVIQEWPQSGERMRGLKNMCAVIENFPDPPKVEVNRIVGDEDRWVLTPTWTPLRTSGTGDTYTVESRIAYPNGEVWSNDRRDARADGSGGKEMTPTNRLSGFGPDLATNSDSGERVPQGQTSL
jgi:hypothetical protein